MFNNIIVPVELGKSDAYESAVQATSALLSEGGEITLLHVIEPIPTYAQSYIPPDFEVKSREDIQHQLDSMARKIKCHKNCCHSGWCGAQHRRLGKGKRSRLYRGQIAQAKLD